MGTQIKQLLLGVASKVVTHKVATALGAIGTALSALALALQNYLVQYMPQQSQALALWLIIALSLILTFIIATYFWFKPKLVVSQKDGGCWLDENTGIRYCVSCKTKFNQLSPLGETNSMWRCSVNGCWATYIKKA